MIFDSTLWSTYSNVLNSGIAKNAVIIRGDMQIVVSGPITYCMTLYLNNNKVSSTALLLKYTGLHLKRLGLRYS